MRRKIKGIPVLEVGSTTFYDTRTLDIYNHLLAAVTPKHSNVAEEAIRFLCRGIVGRWFKLNGVIKASQEYPLCFQAAYK